MRPRRSFGGAGDAEYAEGEQDKKVPFRGFSEAPWVYIASAFSVFERELYMQDAASPQASGPSSSEKHSVGAKQKVPLLEKGTVRWLLGIVGCVVVLDQLSKILILNSFASGEIREIIPGFFNLTLHFNPGVAFGMFANLDDGPRILVLTFTTVLALALVLYFLMTEYRFDKHGQFALALVMGGAVGNIIDRVRIGEVVDFLDFYLGSAHWPAFNVADSAICVGVTILIFKSLFYPSANPGESLKTPNT